MIEITPISTTHPIKKTHKVIHERQQQSGQNQAEEHKKDEENDSVNEQEQQHIDEIV